MGRLSDQYKDQAASRAAAQAQTPPPPAQPQTAPASDIYVAPKVKAPGGETVDFGVGAKTKEEQVKQFGGEIGSPEYYRNQAEHPYKSFLLRSALSMIDLPNQEAWDAMKPADKAAAIGLAIPSAVWRTVKSTPKETVRAVGSLEETVRTTWADVAAGKRPTFETLGKKPVPEVPWLGEIPTWFQSNEEARKSGLGPLAAAWVTGWKAVGDVTITHSIASAARSAFRPRAKTMDGLPVLDTEPIKSVIKTEEGVSRAVRRAPDSPNEYYSLDKTTAKRYGGTPENTFVKLSPGGLDGSQTFSIVQTRGNLLQRASDKLTGKKTYRGDFGPEITLESQTGKFAVGEPAAIAEGGRDLALASIPPKPLKGFEKAPITEAQVQHVTGIVSANGLSGDLANGIMRAVTGKSTVGELTQSEYVQLAQSLGGIAKSKQFTGSQPVVGLVQQWLSPQRHFTRSIENRGGPAVYSKVYVPIEDAFQAKRVFLDGVDERLNQMYGKYAEPAFSEERRLIREATEGRTDVIEKNPTLTPEAKTELMAIVEKRRAFYDEMGPTFGIGEEYFLENYSPRIENLGGVHQLYKEGADFTKEFSPFFEKKRHGSLNVMVDDALALDQIYARAGANKLFLNPAFKNAGEFIDTLEPTLKGSMKSMIQEKLGYADRVQQYVDEALPSMLGKLGIKAPPDIGRQVAQTVMNTTYSSALGGNVASAIRNTFTAFTSYARQGPEFFAEALAKASTREGVEELRRRGLLVKLGTPSGADLASESTVVGQARSRYTRFTQATLKGQEISDSFTRSVAFWQAKLKWDDAFARYKSGQINWEQLERAVDFNGLDPLDRNIIRQDLVAGNAEKAFNHYAREIIDETNFPFRRGSSFRAGYGFLGKAGFQFAQWPIEQAHMLGRWVKTRQWDKVVRWYAAGEALNRTLNDAFGVDVRNSFGVRTVVPGVAPLVKLVSDAMSAGKNASEGNQEQFEKDKDGVMRALTLFVPAGGQARRILDFKRSVEEGPIGPDGTYKDFSGSGKLDRYATLSELWLKLWGFTPSAEFSGKELGKEMRAAKFMRTDAKAKAMELMQKSMDEKGLVDTGSQSYKDAVRLIEENGIRIGGSDFDAYHIPYNERLFNSLPPSLKAEFAPRVYPQK